MRKLETCLLLAPILFVYGLVYGEGGPTAQERRRWESEAREVTILRDKWGVPHIYGKTDASAVFGLLYTECQTDFPRVEKNYLEMLGRQAEVYGESYLYTDVMMRLIYDSVQAIADYL
jgi:acyl-homoserine lactone acylase PvdQ